MRSKLYILPRLKYGKIYSKNFKNMITRTREIEQVNSQNHRSHVMQQPSEHKSHQCNEQSTSREVINYKIKPHIDSIPTPDMMISR
ncbi:hypothetical protein Fmac_012123 [Flemingia macrophylla]|uniref:Uncharacterized protein n=1 Tax=Flemingia macrophylla TaxID=520843 RepID=A0ABD1MPD1_9FABA